MKKVVLVVILLCFLTGCGNINDLNLNAEQEPNILFFNQPEIEYHLQISFVPHGFIWPISEEQLSEIFPFLEGVEWVWTQNAEYHMDGTLAELLVRMRFVGEYSDYENRMDIYIGVGAEPRVPSRTGFEPDFIYQYSDIYGVLVKAIMVSDDWSKQRQFEVQFVVDGAYFWIRYNETEERGQVRINEVVSLLIQNSPLDFSVIEDPVVPYVRSDDMTLDEAQLDSDFGDFVPTFIPGELTFSGGHRYIQEHWDSNGLSLGWQVDYDKQYLYEIYTQWVVGRSSDTPVYVFEQVNWSSNQFSWDISNLSHGIGGTNVSAQDFLMHDLYMARNIWRPTFPADEITLELLERVAQSSDIQPQGADWEEYEEEGNIFIPVEIPWFMLGVLFDDVVIDISVAGFVTPEMIWAMIQSIPALN